MFFNTPPEREGVVSLAKGASAWALVGITSWADVAAVLAAIYSMLLIGEWVWKKLGKRLMAWWKARSE